MREAYRTCNICEACCGLTFELDGERIARVRGDAQDPFSRGYCCPKGPAMQAVHDDPDRLRRPLVRRGGALVEASWDEAFDAAASGLAGAIARHGRHAFAHYIGNPTVHNVGGLFGSQVVRELLPSRNRYSANSQDANPHLVANVLMFGAQLIHPVPDLERARLLVIIGANPLASNGSLMTAPAVGARLRAIRKRGGRVIVIDPRRTETAAVADRHLAIRPGADAALLLALAHALLDEGLAPRATLERLGSGLDRLPAALAPFAPERVAPALGPDLGAAVIRELARDLAREPRAAVYGRLGLCLSRFAGLAAWGLNLVNALAGNLDVEGGLCFPEGPGDHVATLGPFRGGFARYTSPQGLPEVGGEYPCVVLADQIESAAKGAPEGVRAMLVQSGNPVLSAPNGPRLARAFASLEALVAVDIYPSETARLAHVVLPPRSALHDPHFDFVFGQLSVESFTRVSPPVLPPPADGQPSELEILKRIALDTFDRLPRALRPLKRRLVAAVARRLTTERLIDAIIRSGPRGDRWNPFSRGLNLRRLLAHPHGLPVRPLEPGRLPRLLARAGRRAIDLLPLAFERDLGRLAAEVAAAGSEGDALVLIGRRHLKSNNSWLHNVARLRGPGRRCTLLVHPEDARARGLVAGEPAEVRSRAGALEVEVEVTDEVARGVVSLPHGWGHAGHGGRVAGAEPGVSVNDLTDERAFDPLTGTAALNHVPVRLARIEALAAAPA